MGEITNEFEIFKLSESLTIWEAAILLLGKKPSKVLTREDERGNFSTTWEEFEPHVVSDIDGSYQALKKAIIDAVRSDHIMLSESIRADDVNEYYRIRVSSLKNWVKTKGFKCDFFNISEIMDQPYLDQDHPHFSLKLYAAVKVWMEFKDAEIEGESPKSTIKNWLSGHAVDLNLVYDGKSNKSAIEEVAKIVNWETKGGAPRTPVTKEEDVGKIDDDETSGLPF